MLTLPDDVEIYSVRRKGNVKAKLIRLDRSMERNLSKLEQTELNSDLGRQYVRLRISEWC